MITIRVKAHSGVPLPTLTVGRASAFRAKITGVPEDCENVQISFEVPPDAHANAAVCDQKSVEDWTIYASGAYFPHEGTARYHITARTLKGDSIYLGCGTLIITPSVLNVESFELPVIPPDCYVRGADGLYYKVTAALDDDGVPYMIVAKEGVSM